MSAAFYVPLSLALAQNPSGNSYQIKNPQTVPATSNSSGNQFKLSGAVASMVGRSVGDTFILNSGTPVVTTPSSYSGGGGGVVITTTQPAQTSKTEVSVFNVQIVHVTQDSAVIHYDTDIPVQGSVAFYEKNYGKAQEQVLPFSEIQKTSHALTIFGLKPATSYVFVLLVKTASEQFAFGDASYVFKTLVQSPEQTAQPSVSTPSPTKPAQKATPNQQATKKPLPTTPTKPEIQYPQTPSNFVENFQALSIETGVFLVWDNPRGAFDRIEIYRSTTDFPSLLLPEERVYAGLGANFTDATANPGEDYYYTLVVLSREGTELSRSVARTEGREDIIPFPESLVVKPTENESTVEQNKSLVSHTTASAFPLYIFAGISLLAICILIFFLAKKFKKQL